jgi:hypothetical protein
VRGCIESIRGELFQREFYDFELFLVLLCHFVLFAAFHAFLDLVVFPLLLDDFFEIFLAF